jgi:hypothetical protein
VIEEDLSNQFQTLNVIDGTESKTIASKPTIFSQSKLFEVMKKKAHDDDDDD